MVNSGYSDDPTITNEAELGRRIPPLHFIPDLNTGRIRPSTAAFKDHQNGSPMSVLLADVLIGSGRGPLDVLANFDYFALASITAGLARACRQGVARRPLPDELAHAEVFGKKTYGARKRFVAESSWIIPPPTSMIS